MPNLIPDGITSEDILNALRDLDAGVQHDFGDSTGWDLEYNGKKYPPKAVVGLSARRLLGWSLGPYDFKGGKGTKCFQVLEDNGFNIIPKESDAEHAASDNWVDTELKAAVDAYSWMLRQELDGQPYEKSTVNHSLREGVLRNRSKGSVEYRMQNISAVLLELGLPWINGYKPSGHVGDRVKALISKYLTDSGITELTDFMATSDPEALDRRTLKLLRSKLLVKPTGNSQPTSRTASTTQYDRDPKVKAWVLHNAAGKCELCTSQAPFMSRDGNPYLEVHHVVPLASGGPDTIENAVALCPNCHRRCHNSVDAPEQIEKLTSTVTRLISIGS